MIEMKNLFKRLHTLMDKGQSGVIAVLDDGTVVMWINPLRTVFSRNDEWGDSYLECAYVPVAEAEHFLTRYDGQAGECLTDDDARFGPDYLQDSLELLLWHMAHETSTRPDGDMRDDAGEPDYDLFQRVSVTGAADLESDIAEFFRMGKNRDVLTLRVAGGGSGEFCMDICWNDFVLYKCIPEPFYDNETDETIQVKEVEPVLYSGGPGALYARYRALLAMK